MCEQQGAELRFRPTDAGAGASRRHAGAEARIEDDGQPAKVPGRRTRPEEDDPSQPWSPNYGRGKNTTERPVEQPVTRPATPRQIDAGTSVLRRAALSEADADTIVAMAISAHEARHR